LFNDSDYHRRRSELELEKAVSASCMDSARAHLELARMHRARRRLIVRGRIDGENAMANLSRTDKEA